MGLFVDHNSILEGHFQMPSIMDDPLKGCIYCDYIWKMDNAAHPIPQLICLTSHWKIFFEKYIPFKYYNDSRILLSLNYTHYLHKVEVHTSYTSLQGDTALI